MDSYSGADLGPWQPGPWPGVRRRCSGLLMHCSNTIGVNIGIVAESGLGCSEFLDPPLFLLVYVGCQAFLLVRDKVSSSVAEETGKQIGITNKTLWALFGCGTTRKRILGGLKAYLRATDYTCSNIISRDGSPPPPPPPPPHRNKTRASLRHNHPDSSYRMTSRRRRQLICFFFFFCIFTCRYKC
jgi:hypothetical protein